MVKKLAKWCAKFALGYLPDVVAWAVKYGTDKMADSEKAKRVLDAVEKISADANALALAMKDGEISPLEESKIRLRVEALAEELKALL